MDSRHVFIPPEIETRHKPILMGVWIWILKVSKTITLVSLNVVFLESLNVVFLELKNTTLVVLKNTTLRLSKRGVFGMSKIKNTTLLL